MPTGKRPPRRCVIFRAGATLPLRTGARSRSHEPAPVVEVTVQRQVLVAQVELESRAEGASFIPDWSLSWPTHALWFSKSTLPPLSPSRLLLAPLARGSSQEQEHDHRASDLPAHQGLGIAIGLETPHREQKHDDEDRKAVAPETRHPTHPRSP